MTKPTDRDDDTVEETARQPATAISRDSSRPPNIGPHYVAGDVIGRGGMGEVVLARDLRIGRDVAIKRMRCTGDEEARIRFLREAKIQARLDHPAIPPVHEVGTDADGEPYFTMKRLAGVTLATLLAAKSESRQRLLRTFVDVALAVDLAHSRRIVHRDLKPANIMLGDFGEVYVLDWGLARDIDEAMEPAAAIGRLTTPALGVTAIGALLGTPGYMPPEQIHDASSVGIAADSYALGAILFEILCGEPLHSRTDPVSSTLEGVDASPIARSPEAAIPPELDRLCRSALVEDPAARPTARVLAEEVQHYLDGDRDLAMRRSVANEAFEQARVALRARRHDEAIRAAGRALALDPSSPAADIVSGLMLAPPDDPPPGLRAELAAADSAITVRRAKHAVLMFLSFVPLCGLGVWNGVRSWPLLGSIAGLSLVLSFVAYQISRDPARADRHLWAYAVGNATLVAILGRVCSPLIIAPGAACIIIMSIVMYPTFARHTWLVIGGVVLGWMIPVALELLSLVRSTWDFAGGVLTIRSYAIELGGSTTFGILAILVAVFLIASMNAISHARSIRTMQQQLIAQRWQLGHLIPHG